MNTDNIQKVTALSDAFSLLSILTEYPTSELASAITCGSLAEDVSSICSELGIHGEDATGELSRLLGQCGDEILVGMKREYTRLFNHPENPEVPLYEGQFLFQHEQSTGWKTSKRGGQSDLSDIQPRLFVNPASLDAAREYRGAGLKQHEERSIPADAMPVEMAFMAQLYFRLADAHLKNDDGSASVAHDAIDEFRHYHLDKWMFGFYQACAFESQHPVYCAAGHFGTQIAYAIESWNP